MESEIKEIDVGGGMKVIGRGVLEGWGKVRKVYVGGKREEMRK